MRKAVNSVDLFKKTNSDFCPSYKIEEESYVFISHQENNDGTYRIYVGGADDIAYEKDYLSK